jgi:acylphosphatase
VQPNSAEKNLAIVLRGRVQGVGFRWWSQREARRLGVRGTVQNRPDGSVEIQAAANSGVLARFEKAVREGPPGARVVDLETVPSAPDLPPDFLVLT